MKVLGNKYISIEVDELSLNGKMANLVLVIDRFKIGTLESSTYIPSFFSSLECLCNDKHYYINNIDLYRFSELVKDNKLEEYKFTLEDTFDDFMKRCVRNNNTMFFYLKLYDEHFFSYKENSYNTPVIKYIPIAEYAHFLNVIRKYFTDNYLLY